MADRGSVGRGHRFASNRVQIPVWTDTPSATPVNGSLTINVTDGGVAAEGIRLKLFYRRTMQLIMSGRTNAAGTHVFPDLDPTEAEAYMVLASAPMTGDIVPHFHAQTFDKLSAV